MVVMRHCFSKRECVCSEPPTPSHCWGWNPGPHTARLLLSAETLGVHAQGVFSTPWWAVTELQPAMLSLACGDWV